MAKATYFGSDCFHRDFHSCFYDNMARVARELPKAARKQHYMLIIPTRSYAPGYDWFGIEAPKRRAKLPALLALLARLGAGA